MRTHVIRGLATAQRRLAALLRAMGRFGTGLANFNREQSRLATVSMSQDAYLVFPGTPPDTYAEFLIRTTGPLRHEPSARSRLAGETVH
jgi:hypothetical protein